MTGVGIAGFGMGRLMVARLEHREHAVGNGKSASGIAVIATFLPAHQAIPPPIAIATKASPILTIRYGFAVAPTSKAYRKLASMATAMPNPATLIPEGAVTGEDIRLRPYMNRRAATRSTALIMSCGMIFKRSVIMLCRLE